MLQFCFKIYCLEYPFYVSKYDLSAIIITFGFCVTVISAQNNLMFKYICLLRNTPLNFTNKICSYSYIKLLFILNNV